jgi:hypothetical protein
VKTDRGHPTSTDSSTATHPRHFSSINFSKYRTRVPWSVKSLSALLSPLQLIAVLVRFLEISSSVSSRGRGEELQRRQTERRLSSFSCPDLEVRTTHLKLCVGGINDSLSLANLGAGWTKGWNRWQAFVTLDLHLHATSSLSARLTPLFSRDFEVALLCVDVFASLTTPYHDGTNSGKAVAAERRCYLNQFY